MRTTKYKGSRAEARALGLYVKLMRAAEAVTARVHGPVAAAELTVSQFGALEALYHLGPLKQGEIARKILKTSGNLTMVIDNLEKRGLARRSRGTGDRRVVTVHLTPEGRELMASIFPEHAGRIREAMGVLSAAEQEDLARLLRKVGRAAGDSQRGEGG